VSGIPFDYAQSARNHRIIKEIHAAVGRELAAQVDDFYATFGRLR